MLVPIMQPICVFKCTPPDVALYGIIASKAIIDSFNTPHRYAIINSIKVFGTSPITNCNP